MWDQLKPLLHEFILGNSLQNWLFALACYAGLRFLIYCFRQFLLSRLERWAQKTKTRLDDEWVRAIAQIPTALWVYISFYFSLQFLSVPSFAQRIADVFLIVLIFYWITKIANDLIEFILSAFSPTKGWGPVSPTVRFLPYHYCSNLYCGALLC
ncbi:hypothetical protein IPJ72_07160 [Candidatus Peregrinibacteria bacterium]|nr:MAG: hypothetical protein IPJ72_07160 [Candidatus Peregrinibacteria bacterium]